MPRPRLEARAGVPHKPKRAFHGLRRFVVNELGDLRLAGWWVGQSSLRVTAGYERDRMERLNEARERLDRKETAGEVATDVATGISKALPRRVGASGFEPPTSWSRNGDRVSRRTTECSTNAVFWAGGVVPRELKSLRSSEKLTPKLTPRATSWTDFRRSLLLVGRELTALRKTATSWIEW